ncbi:MAG: class I SAM-dependent methyltransferase [Bacteroidetes bacterium]|nr:class I SAM-dependent methyltransferase [Bacteroidota bacterium]MBS1684963.1 class I SAM-dependent methyltransferase [Bacteroidota bacterium]
MRTTQLLKTAFTGTGVQDTLNQYANRFDHGHARPEDRIAEAAALSSEYYGLATDFYLHGWGKLFHFGVRQKGQSMQDSLLAYETYLADKLQLHVGERCLDLGCGVGGPMINIAKYAGVSITGINNSFYQIEKGQEFVREARLSSQCNFLYCDWMKVPMRDGTFNKAYGIEATCHAAGRRTELFREVHRLLSPGGLFATYEWVMTEKYDATDPRHQEIKRQIEIGDGLSDITDAADVTDSLQAAGFEVMECKDRATECDPQTPWYQPLCGDGRFSISQLRTSPIGRRVMHTALSGLERLHLIPQGSTRVHEVLETAADGLVAGGELGIFTPMLFVLARKV